MGETWQIDKASVMRKLIIIVIGIANIGAMLLFFMWANAHFKGWEREVKVEVEVEKIVEKVVYKDENIVEKVVHDPTILERFGIMQLSSEISAKILKDYDPVNHIIYEMRTNQGFDVSLHKGNGCIYIITWPSKFSKPRSALVKP